MALADAIRNRLLRGIKAYQRVLAPRLPPMCRFTPSCSHYGYQALLEHGLFKGVGLTIWRLFRCNPLCRGGLDPVPPRRQITASAAESK